MSHSLGTSQRIRGIKTMGNANECVERCPSGARVLPKGTGWDAHPNGSRWASRRERTKVLSRRDACLRPWRRAYPPSIIVKNPVCDGYFRVDSCRREGAQPLSLLPTIRLCNFPWLSQTAALFHDAPDCGKISASMSGAVQSAVTAAGRGCVAALALALVLHGSTKHPPLRQSAAPASVSAYPSGDFLARSNGVERRMLTCRSSQLNRMAHRLSRSSAIG